MTKMIEQILSATSVTDHVVLRSKYERRELAVVEEDLAETAPDVMTGTN